VASSKKSSKPTGAPKLTKAASTKVEGSKDKAKPSTKSKVK